MSDYGLVSIIMPSYNTGRFIGESIESVLKQTYSNWELLIVDDNSMDNTDLVVASYTDDRIKYVKNDKNRGAAYSRNVALKKAKGKWIAFLDSDDLWTEEKLEKQIKFMVDNGYSFSCTKRSVVDENSNIIRQTTSGPKRVGKLLMYCYCWLGCLAVMYDSDVVGLIQVDERLMKNNDYAMWLKVIEKAPCYYLDEMLAYYRIRKQSISHDKLIKLIKSHYTLFRVGNNKTIVQSVFLTLLNLVCGSFKKMFYVRKY